jgi:hypothetical protein
MIPTPPPKFTPDAIPVRVIVPAVALSTHSVEEIACKMPDVESP